MFWPLLIAGYGERQDVSISKGPYRLSARIHGYGIQRVSLPQILILDFTSRCNLRCFMCDPHMYDNSDSVQKYQDMSEELFNKIEPLLAQAEIIHLGGCGEPLISRNVKERLKHIRTVNPDVYLVTFTNGLSLSSRETVAELLPLFNEVHLSLNGVDSYEQVMIGGSLAKLKKNLEIIRDVRKEFGRPENLVMGFIVMRRNLGDIVSAAKLARDMGFSRIQYKNLWVFNNKLKAESIQHDPDLAQAARKEIKKACRTGFPVECEIWPEMSSNMKSSGWGLFKLKRPEDPAQDASRPPLLIRAVTLLTTNPRTFRERLKRFIRAYYKKYFGVFHPACDFPWKQVQIFENGDVFLCCHGNTKIGNLVENSFKEIWEGKEAQRYRKGMINQRYYGGCAKCKLLFKDNAEVFIKTAELSQQTGQ